MRIEALKQVALGLGLLGFATFVSAFAFSSSLPNEVRELSLLAGIVAVIIGIVFQVVVVVMIRKRRLIRNAQWLDAFYQRSRAQGESSNDDK